MRWASHARPRTGATASWPPRPSHRRAATEPAPKLRVSPEARAAVQFAGEEAKELGAVRLGSEHLLLGILLGMWLGIAATALRAEGVTLEAARARGGGPPWSGEEPPPRRAAGITSYARKVFGEALRQAAAEPGHVIGVADLLRAALRDGRRRRGADG